MQEEHRLTKLHVKLFDLGPLESNKTIQATQIQKKDIKEILKIVVL